ncbi:MAG: VOC family protein [Pseudomonadota bacterium]
MNNPCGWFEIYVADMSRAKAFYESLFNVELQPMTDPTESGVEMCAFPSDFERYGSAGALVAMEGFAPGAGGTMVYFQCDDCAIEEARADSAGGTVQTSKMSIGEYGFCAHIIDTEGNTIGLHSEK